MSLLKLLTLAWATQRELSHKIVLSAWNLHLCSSLTKLQAVLQRSSVLLFWLWTGPWSFLNFPEPLCFVNSLHLPSFPWGVLLQHRRNSYRAEDLIPVLWIFTNIVVGKFLLWFHIVYLKYLFYFIYYSWCDSSPLYSQLKVSPHQLPKIINILYFFVDVVLI